MIAGMPFMSPLVAEQVGDLDWKVVRPLRYLGHTDEFVVPAGSETDFASVPGAFQWLIPRSGRYTKAAVLHDYLWRHIDEVGIMRSDADGIFRRVMSELGVPFLRRWMMWAAVRFVSLAKSHLHDRPGDLPRLILLLLVPGTLVLAGGAIVLVFLLGFFLLELAAAGVLWLLRRTGAIRERTKPVNRPKVRWTA
jgi:hypothetical protein